MKGFNCDELIDFVEFVKERPIEVRFIEFMPFDKNQWENDKFMGYFEQKKIISDHYQALGLSLTRQNDDFSATSKTYKIPGYNGSIGFISSMSDHFCGGCNRIRLTADGNLKICLFDNRELNLKEMLTNGYSDEEIINGIRDHMNTKKFSHGGVDAIIERDDNRSMIKIGG